MLKRKCEKLLMILKKNGDEAVIKYTKKFDGVKLKGKQQRVAENEISSAYQNITSDFVSSLKIIINNVKTYYKKQRAKPARVSDSDGVLIRDNILPLDCVGIYIPAGTAPLISTVYMTVIPAMVAGVKRIVITTPPDKNGNINPYILAVANLLKVSEIYKVGGAQAIAAMAFGTRTHP